jgi:hypothetical protein
MKNFSHNDRVEELNLVLQVLCVNNVGRIMLSDFADDDRSRGDTAKVPPA